MFTGIISDVGQIIDIASSGELNRLRIESAYDAETIPLGASVANSGACLTVVAVEPGGRGSTIAFDVGAETLAVTTLRHWRAGGRVNLERSLKVGDELGGHMVSGHVDGIAEIVSRRDFDGMAHFRFRAPTALSKFIAVKGSVALDGTSLTVNAVEGASFEVLLIPHTLKVTTWGDRKAGDQVNIEVDQMARYAARLMESGREGFEATCQPVRART
jgi:riboflavin synthase